MTGSGDNYRFMTALSTSYSVTQAEVLARPFQAADARANLITRLTLIRPDNVSLRQPRRNHLPLRSDLNHNQLCGHLSRSRQYVDMMENSVINFAVG